MDSSTGWFGVAIVAITLLLVLSCLLGTLAYVHTRQRRAGKRAVWPDLENGAESPSSPGAGACKKTPNGSLRQDLQKIPPMDLVETLRGLLKEEISKALQHEGISERLERLERRDESSRSPVGERLDRLEKAMSQPHAPWPPPPASPVQAPPPPPLLGMQALSLRTTATAGDEAPRQDAEDRTSPSSSCGRKLGFGPTNRQLRLPDPPEQPSDVNEDAGMKMSLKTLSRQLHKRDMQTTDLHRQLRQCQESLWEQTLEARSASKRLRDLLADPSQVNAERVQELERLTGEVKSLSSLLADAKAAEMRWAWIAKRQRAFFMQNEKMGQEGMELLRRHPAGEIFLAPPPVCLEGDDENCRNPPWDVGTSNINPYAIDSWPFEPNVLAQKASAEPNLHRLDEEGSDSESMSPSEEDGSQQDEFSSDGLQLPHPPDSHGPPGADDVCPPDAPHPEAGMTSRSC
mmetsp:Transcript_89096/g.236708  ORF Transcript_89096/g.236708 Transcript_89096/m.236708 type:complete len:459 (-) Transcript_89096:278-1654(-)